MEVNRISIVGLGCVSATMAACLAAAGKHIIGVNCDPVLLEAWEGSGAISRGGDRHQVFSPMRVREPVFRRQYLNRFVAEVAEGTVSPATIASRSALYVEASTASYERGRAAAHNLVLPAYPGDGGARCVTNCRCHWRITEAEDVWNCYWTLGQAEHCEDCVQRSQEWAPYTYPKR